MFVTTNGIRSYGKTVDARYAQEIGVCEGKFVVVPILLNENGTCEYLYPVELGAVEVTGIYPWEKMN
jgi:hypothetical protein